MNVSPREAKEDWMEECETDPDATFENKKYAIRPYLEYLESRGIDDFKDITRNDAIQFLRSQDENDLAKSTIETRWYYIRSWADWVTAKAKYTIDAREHPDKHDYYDSLEPAREYEDGDNVIANIDIDQHVYANDDTDPREDNVVYFSKETYRNLLEATETQREEVLLRILWDTGVRASEVTSLDTEYINLDDNSMQTVNAKTSANNSKSRRVYYTDSTKTVLRDWMQRGGRAKYTGSESSTSLLLTEKSEEFSSEMVRKTVYKVAKRTDEQEVIKVDAQGNKRRRIYPHAFRHSFAVHRVKAGLPLPYLKSLLGHSSVEITEDNYIEFRDDDKREAYDRYQP